MCTSRTASPHCSIVLWIFRTTSSSISLSGGYIHASMHPRLHCMSCYSIILQTYLYMCMSRTSLSAIILMSHRHLVCVCIQDRIVCYSMVPRHIHQQILGIPGEAIVVIDSCRCH